MSQTSTESNKSRGHKRGPRKEKVKPPTKIIVRRLPPTMTEEEFLEHIEPMPENDAYYFCPADWSLGYDATCRAYITFRNYDEVFNFRDRFDGYVFVDARGVEYPAIVEFAPFQGFAKNKSRRVDNKVNTIEQEPHYQQFLAKLEEEREAAAKGSENKIEFSLDRKKDDKVTSTPLLQYLASKKEKRREDQKKRVEDKRRQREEEKEKRRILTAPSTAAKTAETTTEQETSTTPREDAQKADVTGTSSGRDRKRSNDEKRSDRKKRAAEREQRRREEHQKRKNEKERERKNKDDKTGRRGDNKSNAEAKASTSQTAQKNTESKKKEEESKDGGGVVVSKRYSERRERDRNRNRRDREKQKDDQQLVTAIEVNKAAEPVELPKSNDKNEEEVNDTVRAFIRSVAKEFVPKAKQQEIAAQQAEHEATPEPNAATESATVKETQEHSISEQLEELSLNENHENQNNDKEKRDDSLQKYATKSDEGSSSYSERQAEKSRSREERRIRNKDRPSIAIYQPKARLRMSEERDTSATGKDGRSNPTSDCEAAKKDETTGKKRLRYSERRSERRGNREKQRSSDGDEAGENDCERSGKSEQRKLQKSISLEEKVEKKEEKSEIIEKQVAKEEEKADTKEDKVEEKANQQIIKQATKISHESQSGDSN